MGGGGPIIGQALSVGGSNDRDNIYFYLTVPANAWHYNYNQQIMFSSSWDNTSYYHKELINFSELWPFTLDIVKIDIMGSTYKTDFLPKIKYFRASVSSSNYSIMAWGEEKLNIPTIPIRFSIRLTKVKTEPFIKTIIINRLNIGDTIEVSVKPEYQHYLGESIVWKVADKNHPGYPPNSVTLISDKIIALLPFDAKESTNPDTNRKNYGNNRYSVSNIRQWLNSNAKAGKWYSAQHEYDAPPSAANVTNDPYESKAGFLEMLDPAFTSYLLPTTLTVEKPNLDSGGTETVTDKMFLASNTEVFGTENESKFPLFTDAESRKAYCTQAAIDSSNNPNKPTVSNSSWNWSLRTPKAVSSNISMIVTPTANLSEDTVYSSYNGIRPCCSIYQSVELNSNKNVNGSYELYNNYSYYYGNALENRIR